MSGQRSSPRLLRPLQLKFGDVGFAVEVARADALAVFPGPLLRLLEERLSGVSLSGLAASSRTFRTQHVRSRLAEFAPGSAGTVEPELRSLVQLRIVDPIRPPAARKRAAHPRALDTRET